MIPAHTTAYGFKTLTETQRYDWGPLYTSTGKPSKRAYDKSQGAVTAYSNRPLPVKGNGVTPMNYYRKVGRLWSLSEVEVDTSSHFFIADKSFGYRGFSLARYPHGSDYGGSSVSVPKWMTDQVIQDCVSSLNGIQANILEDFMQTKQTVSMLWGILRTIVELFIAVKNRQWRRLAKRLKKKRPRDAAGAWLMFYYGIKPLIGTFTALCNSQGPRYQTVKRRKRVSAPVDVRNFVTGPLSWVSEGSALQRAECGMTVRVRMDSNLAYWSSLGLTDPTRDSKRFGAANDLDALVTFWAVTPYSFVLDWVIPVERFLRTRFWTSGIDYQTGYVSKTLTCDGVVTGTNVMTGAGDHGRLPKCKVGCLQFQRTAHNHYAPPSGLSLKSSLTSTQAFNAFALIVART